MLTTEEKDLHILYIPQLRQEELTPFFGPWVVSECLCSSGSTWEAKTHTAILKAFSGIIKMRCMCYSSKVMLKSVSVVGCETVEGAGPFKAVPCHITHPGRVRGTRMNA